MIDYKQSSVHFVGSVMELAVTMLRLLPGDDSKPVNRLRLGMTPVPRPIHCTNITYRFNIRLQRP